jgi:hypothetical protein
MEWERHGMCESAFMLLVYHEKMGQIG